MFKVFLLEFLPGVSVFLNCINSKLNFVVVEFSILSEGVETYDKLHLLGFEWRISEILPSFSLSFKFFFVFCSFKCKFILFVFKLLLFLFLISDLLLDRAVVLKSGIECFFEKA